MALARQPMTVTALTKTTKSGELYTRPPEVEAQLEKLCQKAASEQLTCARIADKASPLYLSNECLVYLISEAIAADDEVRHVEAVAVLLKRIIKPVERSLLFLGVADADIEDVHHEVMLAMLNAIAKGRSGEFYQVRFGKALRRQIVKSYDSYMRRKRRSNRELSLDAPGTGGKNTESDNGDGDESTLADLVESGEDVAADVEDRILMREALLAITNEKHREAFVLHYKDGWQIESINPDEKTLSQLYGRTPKMIRNWLRIAERQVAAWRATNGL